MNKKISTSTTLYTLAGVAAVIFAVTLVIFVLNFKSSQPATVSGTKSLVRDIEAQNAAETQQLYKINDDYAFLLGDSGYVAVVKYARSGYPFSFACGTYATVGDSVGYPLQHGDYLFSTYTNADNKYAVYNTRTSTYQTVASLSEITDAHLDPTTATAITQDFVRTNYTALSLEKESCITITMAEVIVVILFAGAGVVVSVMSARKKKQNSTPTA